MLLMRATGKESNGAGGPSLIMLTAGKDMMMAADRVMGYGAIRLKAWLGWARLGPCAVKVLDASILEV